MVRVRFLLRLTSKGSAMSMNRNDYLAFVKEHWLPLTVIGALLVGIIIGKVL